jgi:hypothetical protein
MQRAYVAVRRLDRERGFSPVVLFAAGIVLLVLISCLIRGSYGGLREEYVQKLDQQREALEINNRLKTTIAAMTQTRYIELRAKERLGLQKPREAEVLVVR